MGCTGIQPVGFLGWLASTWAFTEWSPEQGATCSDPGLFLKTLQDFSWLMLSHCPHTCPAFHPSYTLPFLNLTFLFFHISYLLYLSLGCSFCPTDPPYLSDPLSDDNSLLKWPHMPFCSDCFLIPWASILLQEDCSLGPNLGGDCFWFWSQTLSYHWSFWRLLLPLLAQGLTYLVFSRV